MTLAELDQIIKEVCPIYGINSNGIIFFMDTATEEQKTTAEQLISEHIGSVVL